MSDVLMRFLFCELYPERLERELHDHLPSSISNGVRVIPPPCGVDTAWHGAKLISNVSDFFFFLSIFMNLLVNDTVDYLSSGTIRNLPLILYTLRIHLVT